MEKIGFILLLAFFLCFSKVSSQILGLELLGDKDEMVIDFEYDHNFIVLDVRLSKLPLKFLYDTGAEHIILFKKEIAHILGYEYDKNIKIMGADLSTQILAYISRNIPLQLGKGKEVKRDIIVLEDDFLHLEKLTGKPIDGIVGGRFFRGLIVEINYQKKKLILHRKKPLEKIAKGYKKLDLSIEDHKPYLACEIIKNQDTIPLKILLDTGAAIPLLFILNSDSQLTLPDNYMSGNLGKGLGGDIEGFLGKTQQFVINDFFQFNNVITNFQNYNWSKNDSIEITRNGLIGNPLLERFNVIIDYVENSIYMRAKKKYNKEFEYDISGLIIYAFGPNLDNYFVKEVLKGSPAEKAGIIPGDIIKRIGLLSTRFYDLNGIYKRLIKRKNKKIRLKVEREGTKIKKTIFLKDLLSN